MKKEEAVLGMKVRYIPFHAKGDKNHPDCEDGVITGIGKVGDFIFVRYGEERYSKATDLEDLIKITRKM